MPRAPAKPLPQDIAEYFYYDETSPSCLRWKIDRWSTTSTGTLGRLVVSAGDVAGHKRKDGYWAVKYFGRGIKVHRVVYSLHNPDEVLDDVIFDHDNGDNSDNKIANLIPSTDYKNCKNKGMYKNNSTGVSGVYFKCGGTYAGSYVSTYYTIDKVRRVKLFSVSKLGNDEAFRQACEFRAQMIAELNAQGAGYTERHGK